MSKRSLGVLALIIILLMAVVAVAGLDNLPRSARESASTAVEQLATARQQLQQNRQAALATIASDPELFRSQEAAFRSRLDAAQAKLAAAQGEEAKLKQLLEANRRQDSEEVARAAAAIVDARQNAVNQSKAVADETKQWVDYKKRTPELLSDFRSRYERVSGFDVEQAAAPVRKAAIDWPDKRADLEGRIESAKALKTRADEVWQNTTDARAKAEAKDYAAVDYAALIGGLSALETAERQIKEALDTTNALAAQLYVGRDKVLLDLDEDEGKRQRVRVVETKYNDASLKDPKVTEAERWENINDNRFRELQRAVNMVVERKPPGKYDSEAENRVQAPAYAYVAPPGQANQYGSWQNGVWNWLPQYLILSQLLRGPSYPPVRMDDYQGYDRARRSGGTWYGRYGRTWGSSGGSGVGGALRRSMENLNRGRDADVRSSSRPRERWTWGGSSGSFGGSRYQSRGSFGGSRYQSRPSSGFGSRSYSRGFGGRSFRSFGRGRR